MKDADMKSAVLDYIRTRREVSFAELERFFAGSGFPWKGNLDYCSGTNDNIIFWTGWNADAYGIVLGLKRDGLIHFVPASPLVYLIDGKSMALPLVKTARQYNTPHWIPVVLEPGAE